MRQNNDPDRGEHGFIDWQTAAQRAKELQAQYRREFSVINLGFFSGLSVLPNDVIEDMSRKAA